MFKTAGGPGKLSRRKLSRKKLVESIQRAFSPFADARVTSRASRMRATGGRKLPPVVNATLNLLGRAILILRPHPGQTPSGLSGR